MGKITIQDVATHAGTSITTVSRVLSDPAYPVAPKTQERIRCAVKELGYIKSRRSFHYSRKRDIKEISVILPTISNPFYVMAMAGIKSELQNWGYNILLYDSFRSPENELSILRSLRQKRINGVILSTLQNDGVVLREFKNLGMNIILLDQKLDNSGCDHISFEYYEGVQQAVHFLHSIGHREICFVTTPLTRWTRMETYSGYQQALADNGLKYAEELVLIAQVESESYDDLTYETRSGQLLAREFLARGAKGTAVICVNDMVAFGFIQELRENGVRVPEDISVVGFDDIPLAAIFFPSLTTVHCPAVECGRLSAQLILQKITGDIHAGFNMKLNARLIKRNSTAQRK